MCYESNIYRISVSYSRTLAIKKQEFNKKTVSLSAETELHTSGQWGVDFYFIVKNNSAASHCAANLWQITMQVFRSPFIPLFVDAFMHVMSHITV